MADDTDIKKQQAEQKKNDLVLQAKEVKTSTLFDLNINKIFAALHVKAFEQAAKVDSNYKIQNSAIEGDEKKATFYGAGKHLIAAIPLKGEAEREKALAVIKTYTQWFSGPEFANKLNDDSLYPLQSEDTKENNNQKNESFVMPTFQAFLLTEENAEENAEKEDETEDKQKDSDTQEEDTTKDNQEEKTNDDTDKKEITDINSQTAKGFYITYEIKIKGQPEKPLIDALKQLGKELAKNGLNAAADAFKGIGIASFNWRTGSNGKTKTLAGAIDKIKDITKALIEAFGNVDANELQKNYDNNIKTKYPNTNAQSFIYDTKTILQKCKKWLSSKESAKIKEAEYALCTRVDKNDASYKFFNPQFIADTLTKSITGLVKKFRHKVPADNVIHINNYDDNAQNKNRPEGAVADSIVVSNSKLIIEDAEIENKDKKQKIAGEKNDNTKVGNIDIEKVDMSLQDAIKTSDIGTSDNKYKAKVFTSESINDFVKNKKFENGKDIDIEKFKYALALKIDGIKIDEQGNPIQNESNNLFNFIFKNQINESKNYEESDIKTIFDKVIKDNGINNVDELQMFTRTIEIGEKHENIVVNSIMSKIFEDIVLEEEPKEETSENKSIIDDISNELKKESDNVVKTMQLPFEVDDNETKYYGIKKLIKQLKDNNVNDNDAFSNLEKYNGALVVKLSKITGNQDDKGDSIEDRSDEPEQLGMGESYNISYGGKILNEASKDEDLKNRMLEAGKKIFDKVATKFKDNLSENDSNEIINVEYENPTESVVPSFNSFLLEAGKHTATHIKQLIDKVGSKQIISNKDKIIQTIKDYYSNNAESEDTKEKLLGRPEKMVKKRDENGKIIKYTKDDERKSKGKHKKGEAKLEKQEAKPGIIDDFFKLSDDDSMKKWVDNEFAEINKDSKDELPVQAFWKALSLLPEKEEQEKITITFRDIDDPSKIDDFTSLTPQDKEKYKQLGDPIEVIPGEDFDIPEIDDKKGYKFDRWDPDPKEMKESDYTYAIYKELDEEQKDEPEEDNSIKPFQYLILPKNLKNKEHIMSKLFVQAFSDKNEDENNIEKNIDRTDFDFYIVPMKGLKYQNGSSSK